jgi:hypothetical protein
MRVEGSSMKALAGSENWCASSSSAIQTAARA